MSLLDEFGDAVAAVAGKVGGAVVGVGPGWGLGSGIVVARGRVVTNAHNASDGEVTVRFPDGRESLAEVTARDVDGDLAVLAVETGAVEPVVWGGVEPSLGSPVIALASPSGHGLRATFGLVSGTDRAFRGPRGRPITGAIEHTAPMGRGSSGGPLLDTQGRLVGVNTHRLGDGFYLAQPANDSLRARIDGLARGEEPRRTHLGVALAPARVASRLRTAVGLPDRAGVLVHAVDEGAPAGHADLRRGDLLVAAGDRDLASADDLLNALAAHPPGEPLRLRVVRGTDEFDVEVVPDEQGDAP